jgi:hypothetical protein
VARSLRDPAKQQADPCSVDDQDELSQPTQLTSDAMKVLQAFAHEFLEVAFNSEHYTTFTA